jgi:serine/threonine protein kinase
MLAMLGHYKILDRLGVGGMGDVYRARDTRLGRTVAIKVLSAEIAADDERRAGVLRDARASAALSHPNIAALYETGEDQGHTYLVFEFVPGNTLKSVIGGRPLNPRRAIELAIELADGLAEAHAEGIVHHDIKPNNIIVTPKGHAKILDVGLAAWTSGGAERQRAAASPTAGMQLDTVAYMSPEQVLGQRIDERSDLFSLGVVLFEMITGAPPFAGTPAKPLAPQIVQAPAPAPSSRIKGLPLEFDAIVLKALAKSIDQRYESAVTFAAELRALAAILDERSDANPAPPRVAGTPRPRRRWLKWGV